MCVSVVYMCCILAVCKCHCRYILVQSPLLTVSFLCGFFVFTSGVLNCF